MFIKKCISLLAASALIFTCPFTVHASETTAQPSTEATTKAEEKSTTAQPSNKAEEPTTAYELPPALTGTGTVISSERAEDGKVFYTIEATDGSIFYLIIDNDSISDNVYFLTPVTLDNLASFATSTSKDSSSLIGSLFTSDDEKETGNDNGNNISDTEHSQDTDNTKGNFLSRNWQLIAVFTVMFAAIPIIYYIKIIKPKKAKNAAENQEYDIYEEEICEPEEPDNDNDNE